MNTRVDLKQRNIVLVFGIALTVGGFGLILTHNIIEHANQSDYVLPITEISPGNFQLGNVNLKEDNQVSVTVAYRPGEGPINISISSQEGTIIWHKKYSEPNKITSAIFENIHGSGIYKIRTTNFGIEPVTVHVWVRNIEPSPLFFDTVETFFIFHYTEMILPLIGIFILIVGLAVFFDARKKIKNKTW